ncbi:hypothetical protein K3495_g13339 [Podosphaera aphanis]|nr:hypothetical protein K3495_g13339 [Podosphaera aphanis]
MSVEEVDNESIRGTEDAFEGGVLEPDSEGATVERIGGTTNEEMESTFASQETSIHQPELGKMGISHESAAQEPSLKRSGRTRKQIEPRSAWQPRPHALNMDRRAIIPRIYSDAVNGTDRLKWQAAIDEELESLRIKEVFKPITHVPHGRRIVGSRWVFTIKSDGRFKARLVAQGYSQVYGIDYFDTYSPTLRMDSLRILLAVSAYFDWEIHQVDVKTAYLEDDLQEEVYMRCPEGMTGTDYVRVNKALYGLKQSGRAWYQKLDSKLVFLRFRKSESDQCIYIHPKFQIIIGVYVDDLILCGKVLSQVLMIKRKLSCFFPIKDLNEINVIIGWKVTCQRATRTLKISQAHYLKDKIKSFGLQDSKSYTSPLDGYDGILPGSENETLADESAYASAIGSLGYASNGTRPDISFAVSQLSSFNSRPVDRHWKSVCRISRYLNGSLDYSISYSFGPSSSKLGQESTATMYSDSDFASDTITRRSVSGFVVMLGGGPVCWQSRRQKSVSTSTAECHGSTKSARGN